MTDALIAICILLVPVMTLAEEKNSDKVLATVGNEKITEADILAEISMFPPQIRVSYETPEGMKKLLDQEIKSRMLSQEAHRLEIHTKEDVARKIKGISDTIIIQELTKQEVTDKITVKEEAISAFYQENKEKFIKPEEVKVNLIFFEVNDDDPPQKKKEKQKKAEQVLKKIKEGEKIEKLAEEFSDDKLTNQLGGNTGYFTRGKKKNTYGEVFEEKAFSIEEGALSDVFEDKKGFYIIKVAAKKQRRQQGLHELKKSIKMQLLQKKQKEAYENYVESLKKRYSVTIY
jgi:peptidyl-prolyl cis-trans isomerase C